MAKSFEFSDEDIQAAVDYWMSSSLWQERLSNGIDKKKPGELRSEHADIPQRLMTALADDNYPHSSPLAASRIEAMTALHFAGYPEPKDVRDIDRVVDKMIEVIQQKVNNRMQELFHPDEHSSLQTSHSLEILPKTPVGQSTPLISEHLDQWKLALESGWWQVKKIDPHSARQYLVSARLFIEIFGDKCLGDITFEDAISFHQHILQLPSSHGKGRHVHALEAIRNAERDGAERMKMKTVKRHNTAMNRYWEWLVFKKLIPRSPSPFHGHRFSGTKASISDRDDWTAEYLERLFRSTEYSSYTRDSAWHWLPLISLHSGMRLEEICRLRPCDDIRLVNGVTCFIIQAHPDGWDPKTEAGERKVPVHPWLIKHGLLRLVETRRNEGAPRLFPELPVQHGKLGGQFSREFSRLKIGLGIGKKTVFHSFRHTFSTIVNGGPFQDSDVDAVMGHEGARGAGRIYKKRVSMKVLNRVVNSFSSPLPLDFLNDFYPKTGRRHYRKRGSRIETVDGKCTPSTE